MLRVSKQQQQKLPDCLSRENRLGKPGLHRSNFGGISGRKNTGDFPKPFHLLWQNLKWEKISICKCEVMYRQGRNQDLHLAKQKYEILTGHKNHL